MKQEIPLASRFNAGSSRRFSAENLVNMYAEVGRGLEAGKILLRSVTVPKLWGYTTPGASPRGQKRCGSVQLVITGNTLYSVVDGVPTARGTVDGSGNCDICFDGITATIVADARTYVYGIASGAFSELLDPDVLTASSCDSIDEYTLLTNADTGSFQYSALGDGTSYDGLAFVTAETSPDKLVAVRVAQQEVVGFGVNSIEFFRNTGNPDQIFQRSTGAAPIEIGCVSRDSIAILDNSFFWLGRDRNSGGLIVFKAMGYQAKRISNHAVENFLEGASDLSRVESAAYARGGHTFYSLTIPDYGTLVYDAAGDDWHQRAQGLWAGGTKMPMTDSGWKSLAQGGAEPNTFPVICKDDGRMFQVVDGVYAATGRPNVVQPGASYAYVAADTLVRRVRSHSGNMTDTIPQAGTAGFENGKEIIIAARTFQVTLTPTTSTINGAASLVIPANVDYRIISNGTNYVAELYTLVGTTREITFPPIVSDNEFVEHWGLELLCSVGVGEDLGDADPVVELWMSDDGGETFWGGDAVSLGRVGDRERVVRWKQNYGRSRNRTYRVRTSSACDFSVMRAFSFQK